MLTPTGANKVFVTNGGIADICLMFARTDPAAGRKGISVIVAERGSKGFVVGDLEDLCGMRANPVSSIRLYDCMVPKDHLLGGTGQGLAIGLAALDTGRIGIAAQALGIAQAALDEGVRYANQRQQFGVPLARHQAIQMMIADMATQTEAARLLVYRAAMLKDQDLPVALAAAQAKLFISHVENDRLSPPVGFILRLAQVMKIDPGTFLHKEERAAIRDRRSQAYYQRTQSYSYATLTPEAASSHLRAFMITIEAHHDHKPVAFKHEGEEFIYVMEGDLEFTLGSQENVLKPGESIHFNSDVPHKLKSLSAQPTRCLVVLYTV
ncbi:MAG: acyl-CoA dehydrogenase family protein [Desulfobacterales bacterium]